MMNGTRPLLLLALLLPLNVALAAESVEERLTRLERQLDSQSLLDMLQRIDALQQEVQQLRGQLEEQQHTISGLKDRQRELYLDVDRRMSRLEREGVAAPVAGNQAATPATDAKGTEAPADEGQAERDAYQNAFDLLRELRYEEATVAFRDFLKNYPDGRYAHIAQYWLGEAGYARRDFKQAIVDYEALLKNFPDSPKRAEAMLKIGYSQYEMKQPQLAQQILEQLVQQYPDSTEAGQGRNLLKRMKQNGG